MKSRFLSAVAASAGIVLTSCDKPGEGPPSAPPKSSEPAAAAVNEPAAPADSDEPTEAEKNLAAQVQELEAREIALQQQLEDQRLAAAEAEIAKERELLEKEREAWALESQLAEAEAAAVPVAANDEADYSGPGLAGTGDYQTFYDDLAPLGSWYEAPDYGYVWQPTVAISDVTWRPYTRGRWACADRGWTWCSDEPFGWACYHYGRWAHMRGRGWCWVPGDQWAPAWVSWRKTDKYVGWCPLPPETVYDYDITYGSSIDRDCGIYPGGYVFMPVRHFDQPVFSHCEVPSVCLSIYHTSINITNLVIHRHRVDCGGPSRDWISECVKRPVPRYTLAWDSRRTGHGRAPLFEKDRLNCFAPKVYAPWNTTLLPARTKASLAGAEVERGENGLPAKLVSHYQLEKLKRGKEAENLKGAGKKIVEHQNRLASLQKTREEIRQERQERATARPDSESPVAGKTFPGRTGRQAGGDFTPPTTIAGNPSGNGNANASGPARRDSRRARPETSLPGSQNDEAVNTAAASAEQQRLAEAREQLNSRRAQLEKLRAEREAAANSRPQRPAVTDRRNREQIANTTNSSREEAARRNRDRESQVDAAREQIAGQRAAQEEERRKNEAASRDLAKQNADRAAAEAKTRAQQDEQNRNTKENLARQRAELEQQRRNAEAASREADRQADDRRAAQEEQQRRRQEANEQSKAQIARQRAELEQQRRAADAAAQEAARQNAERAAMAERRRQQEAANEAARAQIAQQRAAMEQQRQAEQQARAERQVREQAEAQRQEAIQRQAQEQAARQREAMEQQRRQAEEQNRQEAMRRQAEEQQARRQAEEQQARRQAEESRRQAAEEQNRRQAEESRRARESSERENRRPGR